MPSVTRRVKPGQGHRDAVAAKLGEAVGRLLKEGHGYTTLGVQRIADEAGIARSTFYLYFPDKAALLIRIAESATKELFTAAGLWVESGFADLELLERTIAGILVQQRKHAALLAAVVEVASYDQEVASFWRARVGGFIDVLRRRIQQGQRNGTITTTLDAATTAAWITWGTERLLAQHVAESPAGKDARLASGLARAIWSTLGRTL